MQRMVEFGVPRRIVAFVMPTGYSFNLDGSTLYLGVATLFVAQAAGVDLTLGQQLVIMLTLLITSKGIAAVPRASLVVLAGVLTSWGLPLEGIAVILAVDEFMDMARTMVNLVGNCLATAVVGRWEGELAIPPDGKLALESAPAARQSAPGPIRLSCGPLVPNPDPNPGAPCRHLAASIALLFAVAVAIPAAAQQRPAAPRPAAARSARRRSPTWPTRSRSTPRRRARRSLRVAMTFDAGSGAGPVLLSLPVWTPGAYEVSDFAKRVLNFAAESNGRPLRMGQARPGHLAHPRRRRAGHGAVRLPRRSAGQCDGMVPPRLRDVQRDQHLPLRRGAAARVSRERRRSHPARLDGGHRNARRRRRPARTARATTTTSWTCRSSSGRFDYDSMAVEGKTHRLASYPAGTLQGRGPDGLLGRRSARWCRRMSAVFQETPWETYTTFLIFDSTYRRRQRARAPELARRHLRRAGDRQPAPRLHHRARDLSCLEREAAAPRRDGPLPLRPLAADAMAVGERGYHRLLRRSRAGAGRHRGLDGVLRAHRGEGAARGRGAADGARGHLALDLDPSGGRQRRACTTRRARWPDS